MSHEPPDPFADAREQLIADRNAELECYRATRSFWPLSLREAIRRRDVAAVKAETARGEAVVEGWLRDSHEVGELRAARDAMAEEVAALRAAMSSAEAPAARCRSTDAGPCHNSAMPGKPLCWQHGGDMVPDLAPAAKPEVCGRCSGRGVVDLVFACPDCNGTGRAR